MTKTILETCDIWDIGCNSDNWEPEFMTIFVTWQLIVTLDSIRNSCDVFFKEISLTFSTLTMRTLVLPLSQSREKDSGRREFSRQKVFPTRGQWLRPRGGQDLVSMGSSSAPYTLAVTCVYLEISKKEQQSRVFPRSGRRPRGQLTSWSLCCCS